MSNFEVVVATNDQSSLRQNLLASPDIQSGAVAVNVQQGAKSAGRAYNSGFDATTAPVIIFAHQDVYFHKGWFADLAQKLDELDATDPNWAVVAPFGMTADGRHIGQVWSTSLGRVVGEALDAPTPVHSIDELVIVVRRASSLRFDEDLPGFHMYGTDIVQAARAAGMGAYACQLPLVHNDNFHGRLGRDFTQAYTYIRRKWRAALPLRTPVVWVTALGLALPLYRLRAWRSYAKREAMALDVGVDPRDYAARCGWEKPAS